jgi:tetratricopeptide (TPR) repeat protein
MHYKAALQRDETNVEAHNNLGHLYLGRGLFEEAGREFQRVIAIDPRNAAAHYNLARQFEAAGEPAAAIDHYRQFLDYAGPEPSAYAADARVRLAALAARINK